MSLVFYITDVETNGLRSAYHEINEISIIRCSDKVQLTEFVKCEYPERSSIDALKITGKTLTDLAKGRSKEEVVDKIITFISEDGLTPAHRCFIGHNMQFDRKFIHVMFQQCNKSCPINLWLDTQSMIREYLKQTDPSTLNITKTATGKVSTNLHASCDMVGIKKISAAHASKVDSRNTYLLWQKLMELGIDHLPLIKTFVHEIVEEEPLDMSIFNE